MASRALLVLALIAVSANRVYAQATDEQVPAPETAAEPTPPAPEATEPPAPEAAAESAPTAPEAVPAEAPAAEPATEPTQQPAWPDQAASNAPASAAPAAVAPAPIAPAPVAPAQPAVQPVAAAEASQPQPPAPDAQPDDAKKPARDEDPMGWAGLTFKLGFAGIHSSDLPNPTYNAGLAQSLSLLPQEQREQYGLGGGSCSVIDERCKLDGRYGLRLALAINLGGDGFGWDIEPYLALSSMAKAYGVYTGPKFDIHIFDSLYIGFGLGLKGAWLVTDKWDFGADLYARLPLRATWYAVNNLALVFEFAFSAGASGYISQAVTVTDPITGSSFRTTPSMNFGAGRAWDASVGFRFP